MSTEIEFLLGKVDGRWDPQQPTVGCPYSYQIWVDSRTLLGHLRRLRVAIDNGPLQRGCFPYYLFLCQMRIKNSPQYGEFKYLNILDLDVPAADKEEITILEKKIKALKFPGEIGSRVMAWFTGKKGFRVAYYPVSADDTELVQINNGETKEHIGRYMEDRDGALFQNTNHDWVIMTQRYLDIAPWFKNRGFKMDIFKHPVTGIQPCIIRDVSPDLHVGQSSAFKIATFWADLTLFMEMKLRDLFTDDLVKESMRQPDLTTVPSQVAVQPPKVYQGAECSNIQDWHTQIPQALKSYFGNAIPTYFRWIRPKDSFIFSSSGYYCKIHGKNHSSLEKVYYVWRKGKSYITCHCRSSNPSTTSTADGYKIFFQADYSAYLGDIPFLEDAIELRKLVLEDHTSFHTTKEKYVRDLILEDSRFHGELGPGEGPFILFVKAGMGCGKTEGLRLLLDRLSSQAPKDKKLRVLAISTRRTCAGFLSKNFGCVPYINLTEGALAMPRSQLPNYDRICISMESLRHLSRKTSNGLEVIPSFDVVVLDEIETILSLFPSETMTSKRDNFLLLAAICSKARRVFALDATLGSKTIGFFRDFNMLKSSLHYSILFNQYVSEEDSFLIYDQTCYLDWRAVMMLGVEKKQRILLVSDRKNAIHVLFQELQLHLIQRLGYNPFASKEEGDKPEKLSLLITGASPDGDKSTAVDCNYWAVLDFLAYSPVITVGNSDMSEWDEQVCLFRGNVLASTAIQMAKRARRIKSKIRHILIVNYENSPTPSIGGKRKISEVFNRHDKLFRDEATYLLREKVLVVGEGELQNVVSIKRPHCALRNLVESCKTEEFASRSTFRAEFERLLKYTGIKFAAYPARPQIEAEVKANQAALNRLRKRSEILTDTTPYEGLASKKVISGDVQSRQNIVNTAVERLLALGAPLTNREFIRKEMTVEEFIEFQKTHPLDKTVYRNSYLLRTSGDCTELEFIQAFETHRLKPDEYAEPFWLFIKKMEAVRTTSYFNYCTSEYFSVSRALKDEKFCDAIRNFRLGHKDGPIWEVYANIFPKSGAYGDIKAQIVHFIEFICPFFGEFYEKVSVREHRKLHKEQPDNPEIPSPHIMINRSKEGKKRKHSSDKLYRVLKEKQQNVIVLSNFMHSVHPRDARLLPETYRFRKYFLTQSNA